LDIAVLGTGYVRLVTGAGLAVRRPLARVPENAMKFAVGVMLTGFGMFWGGEGAGARWPGGDAALPVLIAFTLAASLIGVEVLRRTTRRPAASPETAPVEA